MKKTVEGVFAPAYYNECEAGCPIGFIPKDTKGEDFKGPLILMGLGSPSRGIFGSMSECMVLCDVFKLIMGLELDDEERFPSHKYVGKKVKITIEVEES